MLARLCLAAAGLGLATAPAAADLIVTVGPATVAPGGTATVDVWVSGSDLGSLDFFVAEFKLTPADGVPASGLAFVDPQSGGFTSDAGYVFFGRSGLPSQEVVGGVLTVGDLAAGPAGSSTGPFLLARLELSALGTAALGDRYTVALDLSQSEFQDPNGTLTVSASSTLSGTVTVVPEPGVLVMAALGLVGSAAVRRLARKGGAVVG